MNNKDGALSFEATLDNRDFKARLKELENSVRQMSATTKKETQSMSTDLSRLSAVAGGIFATAGITSFVNQIIQTRGEFQQLEVAFGTILKSKDKANKLMQEMVDLAMKTPFTLQDVATGAKQLLAYGTGAEKITDTLTMLGNVAAGISAPLGDIVYLYGTSQTQGRLYTRDVMQFAQRGIPIYEELAKVLHVNTNEVKDLVEKGSVGFKELEMVFKNLTSESGMFYNLMAQQSLTVTGQISNLKDAWSKMLNEIGKENEGVIYAGIDGLKLLISYYEEIGNVIIPLIATYGAYKASIMVVSAAKAAYMAVSQASLGTTVATTAATVGETAATTGQAVAKEVATVATVQLTAAQRALNVAMSIGPYAAIALAIGALTAAYMYFGDTVSETEGVVNEHVEAQKKASEAYAAEQAKIDLLVAKLKDENTTRKERKELLGQLKEATGGYLDTLTLENLKTAEGEEALKKFNEALRDKIYLQANEAELVEQFKQLRIDELALQKETAEFESKKAAFKGQSTTTSVSAEGVFMQGTPTSEFVGDKEKRRLEESVKTRKLLIKTLLNENVTLKQELSKPADTEQGVADTIGEKIIQLNDDIAKLEQSRKQLLLTDKEGAKNVQSQINAKKAELRTLQGEGEKGSAIKKESKVLDEIKAQYEDYWQWRLAFGKESADKQYSELIAKGDTYAEYLRNEEKRLTDNNKGLIKVNEETVAVKLALINATSVEEGMKEFNNKLQETRNNTADLSEYLKILSEQKISLSPDFSPLGQAKKSALTSQIDIVSEEMQRHYAALLEEVNFLSANLQASFEDGVAGIYTPVAAQNLKDGVEKFKAVLGVLPTIDLGEANIGVVIDSKQALQAVNDFKYQVELRSGEIRSTLFLDVNADKLAQIEGDFAGFAQARKAIEEQYAYDVALIYDKIRSATTDTEREKWQQILQTRDAAYSSELISLDLAMAEQSNLYENFFQMAENLGTNYAREEIARIKKVAQQWLESGKITQDQFDKLMAKLNSADTGVLAQNVMQVADSMKAAGEFASMFNAEIGNAISSTGDLIVSIVSMVDMIKKAEAAQKAMSFASAFTGVLGILSAIVTIYNVVSNIIKANKDKQREAEEDRKRAEIEMVKGASEYNQLLRDRQLLEYENQRITQQNLQAQRDILAIQVAQIEAENARYQAELARRWLAKSDTYNSLLISMNKVEALYKSGQISTEAYQAQITAIQAEIDKLTESYQGMTYAQWEQLYVMGKLNEEDTAMFEAWRDGKEDLDSLTQAIIDNKAALVELMTGTTADQLANEIISAFEQGKDALDDFGQSFEDIMRRAIISQIKAKFIMPLIEGFLEQMTTSMSLIANGTGSRVGTNSAIYGGRDPIEALREKWLSLNNDIKGQLSGLEDLFNIDLFGGDQAAALSGAIKGVSQETASLIAGQMNAMRVAQMDMLDTTRQSLTALNDIARNTYALHEMLTIMKRRRGNDRDLGMPDYGNITP